MNRETGAMSPSITAFAHSGPTSAPPSTSSQTAHDRPPPVLTHPHQGPHLHPNRPGGRQTRVPLQRESQHYPMAERCMCSSCHLSAKLFPRTDDGRIILPTVPVARSDSAHTGGHPHGSGVVYVGEGSDLMQYMLAQSDVHSGYPRPSSPSFATTGAAMTTRSYVSASSPQPNRHVPHLVARPRTGDPNQRLDYVRQSSFSSNARPRSSEDHTECHLDADGDAEMKSLNPATLIGPGVAGAYARPAVQASGHGSPHPRSRPHPSHKSSPLPQQLSEPPGPRRSTREYNPADHEMVMQVSVNRPPSGSHTGLPLPPPIVPMASLTINPSAGRGRPKGKAKSKPSAIGDDSSEGGSSTRHSPMSGVPPQPPMDTTVPDALMSVDRSIGSSTSAGESFGQTQLAPCKPRRGRPPRHEVVPGMGEFTVFL